MMRKKEKSLPRLFAALAVLLALLAALWYARPVDVYALAPGLSPETAEETYWVVTRYTYGPDGELATETRTSGGHALSPEDAAWPELLSRLEELQFRRSLLNPLRPYLHGTGKTYAIEDGDESWALHLLGGENGLSLYFHRSAGKAYWTYGDRLPCTLTSGEETAEALGRFLWEMATPVD